MTDVIRIVGERKLVKSDSTTETSSKTIQNTTETWETTKKGKGYKKVEIPVRGSRFIRPAFMRISSRMACSFIWVNCRNR